MRDRVTAAQTEILAKRPTNANARTELPLAWGAQRMGCRGVEAFKARGPSAQMLFQERDGLGKGIFRRGGVVSGLFGIHEGMVRAGINQVFGRGAGAADLSSQLLDLAHRDVDVAVAVCDQYRSLKAVYVTQQRALAEERHGDGAGIKRRRGLTRGLRQVVIRQIRPPVQKPVKPTLPFTSSQLFR